MDIVLLLKEVCKPGSIAHRSGISGIGLSLLGLLMIAAIVWVNDQLPDNLP